MEGKGGKIMQKKRGAKERDECRSGRVLEEVDRRGSIELSTVVEVRDHQCSTSTCHVRGWRRPAVGGCGCEILSMP